MYPHFLALAGNRNRRTEQNKQKSMSFRELRNFTEVMRNLGYPGMISMDSFTSPNFVLVADILYWLVQRYDPSTDLDDSISTETERIQFLKSAAQEMFFKARIKLNLKRLYGADRLAVKELLKIASVLNRALLLAKEEGTEKDDPSIKAMSGKFMDTIKTIRSLASDLTDTGAELYDSLNHELELRKVRSAVLEQPTYSSSDIQHILEDKISETQEMITAVTEQIENLGTDEENLMVKKKRKAADLERFKKSLARLQTFKPSFMDEYEKREMELQHVYTEYVARWRNLEYLEHVMDTFRRNEEKEIDEKNRQLNNMRKKIKDEELMILRGEKMMDASFDDDELDAAYLSRQKAQIRNQQRTARRMNRPRAASGRRPMAAMHESQNQQRTSVQENMYGYDDDDFDDDDDDELYHSEGDSDEVYHRDELSEEDDDDDDDDNDDDSDGYDTDESDTEQLF